LRAGAMQCTPRLLQLDALDTVGGEDRDPLTLQFL
jgi:hypothetical protein